jgi:serine O-acetyltransferase
MSQVSDATISQALAALRAARQDWRARQDEGRDVASFPSRPVVEEVVRLLCAALYPRRLGRFRGPAEEEDRFVGAKLLAACTLLEREVAAELDYWQAEARTAFDADQAGTVVRLFTATLADIRRLLDADIDAAFLADPAARSVDEILVCYPGVIAMTHHRLAHELHGLGAPMVARIVSEIANERTGIDIHPGASIGAGVFIDHGTGVVIGETAVIGNRVRPYQHVTLGAPSTPQDAMRGGRRRFARHPVVEDDVVIYAGATILGPVTIGARSVVGGNVWLLTDLPPDSAVAQPEARLLDRAEGEGLRDLLAVRG